MGIKKNKKRCGQPMSSTPSSSEGVKHIPRNSCPHCPASQNFPTQLLLGAVLSRFGLFPKAQHPSCCQETTPGIPFILPSSPFDIIDSLATEGVPWEGLLGEPWGGGEEASDPSRILGMAAPQEKTKKPLRFTSPPAAASSDRDRGWSGNRQPQAARRALLLMAKPSSGTVRGTTEICPRQVKLNGNMSRGT